MSSPCLLVSFSDRQSDWWLPTLHVKYRELFHLCEIQAVQCRLAENTQYAWDVTDSAKFLGLFHSHNKYSMYGHHGIEYCSTHSDTFCHVLDMNVTYKRVNKLHVMSNTKHTVVTDAQYSVTGWCQACHMKLYQFFRFLLQWQWLLGSLI